MPDVPRGEHRLAAAERPSRRYEVRSRARKAAPAPGLPPSAPAARSGDPAATAPRTPHRVAALAAAASPATRRRRGGPAPDGCGPAAPSHGTPAVRVPRGKPPTRCVPVIRRASSRTRSRPSASSSPNWPSGFLHDLAVAPHRAHQRPARVVLPSLRRTLCRSVHRTPPRPDISSRKTRSQGARSTLHAPLPGLAHGTPATCPSSNPTTSPRPAFI
jgi:hypothetical protein